LRELLLFVRGRRPPNWNDHLIDGERAVFLSDARSDIELTIDGAPKPAQKPSACLVFESHDAAAAWCKQRVKETEHLKCEIYDHRGMAVPAIATFVNPKYAGRVPNRKTASRLTLAGCVCIVMSPPLFWWDCRASGGLVIPTLLGFTLIVTGVRLIVWGIGMRGQLAENRSCPSSPD
jgi:hypothetical protein